MKSMAKPQFRKCVTLVGPKGVRSMFSRTAGTAGNDRTTSLSWIQPCKLLGNFVRCIYSKEISQFWRETQPASLNFLSLRINSVFDIL